MNLTFEEQPGIPSLSTDEGKVSQILRNFISNALKFTECGEIKVSAALDPGRRGGGLFRGRYRDWHRARGSRHHFSENLPSSIIRCKRRSKVQG